MQLRRQTSLLSIVACAAFVLTAATALAQEPPKDIFGGFITKPNDMDKWHRGTVKEISDNKIVVADQKFKPNALVGKVICPNFDRPVKDGVLYCGLYYRIIANTEDTITTDPEDGKLTQYGQAGDKYLMAGHFRIEKVDNRWVMFDPLDHPFLPMGPSLIAYNNRGYMTNDMLKQKYGTKEKLIAATAERIKSLGWTVTWEQGWPFLHQWQYDHAYYRPQLPHMQQVMSAVLEGFKPKEAGGWLPDSPLKNISTGLGHGSFLDVFDPSFAKAYGKGIVRAWGTGDQFSANDPWIIGYVTEEGDNLFGLLRGDFSLGWCALAGMPFIEKSNWGTIPIVYKDPKNYTKHELAKVLEKKYGTIEKLNQAWGSKYTCFGTAGGYGKGTGLLDEDGKLGVAWIGQPPTMDHQMKWVGSNENCKKDILAFQAMMVEKFYRCEYEGLKSHSPNHLVMGFCNDSVYPEDYWAESRWVDLTYAPPPAVIMNMKDTGKNVIKPFCVPGFLAVEEDSALASQYKTPNPPFRAYILPVKNQEGRGQMYYDNFVNAYKQAAANGTRNCIGSLWWNWSDDNTEKRNWGVVSFKDNFYDGKEATRKGADGKEGTWDDEEADYGDCVTKIRQASADAVKILLGEIGGKSAATKPAGRSGQDIPDNPLDDPSKY